MRWSNGARKATAQFSTMIACTRIGCAFRARWRPPPSNHPERFLCSPVRLLACISLNHAFIFVVFVFRKIPIYFPSFVLRGWMLSHAPMSLKQQPLCPSRSMWVQEFEPSKKWVYGNNYLLQPSYNVIGLIIKCHARSRLILSRKVLISSMHSNISNISSKELACYPSWKKVPIHKCPSKQSLKRNIKCKLQRFVLFISHQRTSKERIQKWSAIVMVKRVWSNSNGPINLLLPPLHLHPLPLIPHRHHHSRLLLIILFLLLLSLVLLFLPLFHLLSRISPLLLCLLASLLLLQLLSPRFPLSPPRTTKVKTEDTLSPRPIHRHRPFLLSKHSFPLPFVHETFPFSSLTFCWLTLDFANHQLLKILSLLLVLLD